MGPHLTQRRLGWAEAYLRTKWHLDPSSRLATIHGPKSGDCFSPHLGFLGVPGPHATQYVAWTDKSGLPLYQLPSGILSRLATTDMPEIEWLCPVWVELGPHLTQYVAGAEAYLHACLQGSQYTGRTSQ